jgi:hypothetical protein
VDARQYFAAATAIVKKAPAWPLVLILIIVAIARCEPTGGLRIDVNGLPLPKRVFVDRGTCSEIEASAEDQFAHLTCSVPVGQRLIVVECESSERIMATIEANVPEGDSHYFQFNGPCSANAESVLRGNAYAKSPVHMWHAK